MGSIRRTVLFEGRVQGVGFRYTACEIAREFDVTGSVRNLPDGRVEMVIEGRSDELDRFQTAVGRAMERNIRRTVVTEGVPSGTFDGFGVRR
ncbi:MAG: acylphosphatase [Phycisphaerales bacterium]|nr:acylphosphatase [Phycisphaerales bacterium]MCB9862745.1 acylphosphatase [Phycisphaerales bacterium]